MSASKCNSNLMIICNDAAALKQVLTIAGMFGLSATNEQSPILDMGTHKIAVLKGEGDEIGNDVVTQLSADIEKLYGFHPALLQGNNALPTMHVHLH